MTRLLAALVLLGLAALMLAGSISEGMKRPTAPHVPTQIEQPREPAPLQRRRVDCESPAVDHATLLLACA